jgi:hypothetical protein
MTLAEFVMHLFDHPVGSDLVTCDNDWRQRKSSLKLALKPLDPALVSQHLAKTFEDAERLLAPFSDAQVAQGLDFCLNYSALAGRAMLDGNVPESARLRAVRSVVPLFQQIMAKRCLPEVCQGRFLSNPLNAVCYMWWDGFYAKPDESERLVYDAASLQVMAAILAIPHLACQESALHGLGHWQTSYRVPVVNIINKFLETTPDLPCSLMRYACNARRGNVQ